MAARESKDLKRNATYRQKMSQIPIVIGILREEIKEDNHSEVSDALSQRSDMAQHRKLKKRFKSSARANKAGNASNISDQDGFLVP